MSKNLSHLTNVHAAAQELHRLFLGTSWYINCQVLSLPPDRSIISGRQEKQEIVVYVRDLAAAAGNTANFNTWPVRYALGV